MKENFVDVQMHKQVERLIDSALLESPAETIYEFDKSASGTHINMVSMPRDASRKFLVMSNAEGTVDVLEKGAHYPCKQLAIDNMQCSFQLGSHLLIGSGSKLFLVDVAEDFAVLGHISLSKPIFSICAMNKFTVVCGQ